VLDWSTIGYRCNRWLQGWRATYFFSDRLGFLIHGKSQAEEFPMPKLTQHTEASSIGNKFKCPHCSGKGKSVRASKPKFKTIYEKQGDNISLFRTSLMQCKHCAIPYAIREKQITDSWIFDAYQDFIVYHAMEEDYTAPVYLGSTASEWSKRQASGVFIKF